VEDESELLDRLLSEGPPVPARARQLPAVDRSWPNHASRHAVEVLRSTELFSDLLPEVEQTFTQRRSRSASRGWQAKFPSRRMGRTLMARSHLELRLLELCEVDARVTRFVEHPVCVFYADASDTRRKHIPDLYVEAGGHGTFVEVKWERDAGEPKNESRWPLIARAINGLGFSYEVLTERHILRQPRADNVATLLRHRRSDAMEPQLHIALRNVLAWGALPFAEVRSTWPDISPSSLYRALTDGWLWTDLDAELNSSSLLRLTATREIRPCD
jgi:hypothetical protein